MYEYLLLVVLLLMSAFFSCTETSLFSLSKTKIKRLSKEKGWRGQLVSNLLQDPANLLTTILLGNMFVNVAASALGERIIREVFGHSLGITVLVMTFLILILGEITPKTIAVTMAETIAPLVSPLIQIFSVFISPIRKVVKYTSGVIIKFIAPSPSIQQELSDDEIKTAISMGEETGQIDDKEKCLIENVLALSHKNVDRVMIPWPEVFSIDISLPLHDVKSRIKDRRFSRIPVYETAKENVIGILLLKNCLQWLRGECQDFDIRAHLIPPKYVPEVMPLETLLLRFKEWKCHLGIVVNEYGDFTGVVTLQDVLDELLADLFRQKAPEGELDKFPDGSVRVRGGIHIDDLKRWTGIDLTGSEAKTVGGAVAVLLDKIPEAGEQVHIGAYTLRVLKASPRRAESILIFSKSYDTFEEKNL